MKDKFFETTVRSYRFISVFIAVFLFALSLVIGVYVMHVTLKQFLFIDLISILVVMIFMTQIIYYLIKNRLHKYHGAVGYFGLFGKNYIINRDKVEVISLLTNYQLVIEKKDIIKFSVKGSSMNKFLRKFSKLSLFHLYIKTKEKTVRKILFMNIKRSDVFGERIYDLELGHNKQ